MGTCLASSGHRYAISVGVSPTYSHVITLPHTKQTIHSHGITMFSIFHRGGGVLPDIHCNPVFINSLTFIEQLRQLSLNIINSLASLCTLNSGGPDLQGYLILDGLVAVQVCSKHTHDYHQTYTSACEWVWLHQSTWMCVGGGDGVRA